MSAPPPNKARRVTLTPVSTISPPSIEHVPALSLSQSCSVDLQGTPAATTATVNSARELALLLQKHAHDAEATREYWACSPRAAWQLTD